MCDGKFGGKFSNYNTGKDITFLLTAIINYIQTKEAIGRERERERKRGKEGEKERERGRETNSLIPFQAKKHHTPVVDKSHLQLYTVGHC